MANTFKPLERSYFTTKDMSKTTTTLLRPKFDVVLASAWISKRAVFQYVNNLKAQLKQYKEKGAPSPPAFKLPVSVQVTPVHGSYDYEQPPPSSSQQQNLSPLSNNSNYCPLEAVDGGEDSLFHTLKYTNLVAAVADGVGGWRDQGVDPSIFSRTLVSYSKHMVDKSFLLHKSDPIDPKEIMKKAYGQMLLDKLPLTGSSTELMFSISLVDGNMKVAQLGDSTYWILEGGGNARNNRTPIDDESGAGSYITHKCPEQEHKFNMPYQLSMFDKLMDQIYPSNGESEPISTGYFSPTDDTDVGGDESVTTRSSWKVTNGQDNSQKPSSKTNLIDSYFDTIKKCGFDTPNHAKLFNHQLKHNDVVLLGTDGFFDNIFPDEVDSLFDSVLQTKISDEKTLLQKVKGFKDSKMLLDTLDKKMMHTLVELLVEKTATNYLDPNYKSPFAKQSGGMFSGGKPDDITIILAWIRETDINESKAKLNSLSSKL
ncbi:Protein phosphatase 2C 7 [Mycoemilia scoparia]|uniref:Protein phosphatase n=1 Tax=Mycoemilia scoparia TaxID=417184 RepID=A0A9W8A608_9FUNG|nr:Protein phosphatase 2C 7 [Mycoemilia scoparia]